MELKNARNSRHFSGLLVHGKTFTMPNIIQKVQKQPTLVLSHNKTLIGQLYSEFKEFFPENNVEYFVSLPPGMQKAREIAKNEVCTTPRLLK